MLHYRRIYKMKTYFALRGTEEEDEPGKNRAARRQFLQEAEEALKEAQMIYVRMEKDVSIDHLGNQQRFCSAVLPLC
jgi:hypothetical protein